MDLAPLLVDWHRAQVRVRVDPSAVPPDPTVAELLRCEINTIGDHALIACVVADRLVEGANWAVDHGLEQHLPFWFAAALEVLWSPAGSGESRVIGARHSELDAVLMVGEA